MILTLEPLEFLLHFLVIIVALPPLVLQNFPLFLLLPPHLCHQPVHVLLTGLFFEVGELFGQHPDLFEQVLDELVLLGVIVLAQNDLVLSSHLQQSGLLLLFALPPQQTHFLPYFIAAVWNSRPLVIGSMIHQRHTNHHIITRLFVLASLPKPAQRPPSRTAKVGLELRQKAERCARTGAIGSDEAPSYAVTRLRPVCMGQRVPEGSLELTSKTDIDRGQTVPHEKSLQFQVIVQNIQHSGQLEPRVLVLFQVYWFELVNLPIEFLQQRQQANIAKLQPLQSLALLVRGAAIEFLVGEVEHDGVGLVEHSMGCDQVDGVVLFVDLLGGEGPVEEAGRDEYLVEVGVVLVGEVERLCH